MKWQIKGVVLSLDVFSSTLGIPSRNLFYTDPSKKLQQCWKLLEEVADGFLGQNGCNFSWLKSERRKYNSVVLMSWPVSNRWIFKEHAQTLSFMLKGFIKLQTVLLAGVILGFFFFFLNWLYKCGISCITDRKIELQETGRAVSTWKRKVCISVLPFTQRGRFDKWYWYGFLHVMQLWFCLETAGTWKYSV